MRDYQLVSPSLDGILRHESISYEGLNRPTELIRAFDNPVRGKVEAKHTQEEQKIIEQYFHDLYGVFIKKLSSFILEYSQQSGEGLKLQAMLQELIKIHRLIGEMHPIIES